MEEFSASFRLIGRQCRNGLTVLLTLVFERPDQGTIASTAATRHDQDPLPLKADALSGLRRLPLTNGMEGPPRIRIACTLARPVSTPPPRRKVKEKTGPTATAARPVWTSNPFGILEVVIESHR